MQDDKLNNKIIRNNKSNTQTSQQLDIKEDDSKRDSESRCGSCFFLETETEL